MNQDPFLSKPAISKELRELYEKEFGMIPNPLYKPMIKYSIILTVHNKQDLIQQVLDGIINNTTGGPYELTIIMDGCTDRSTNIVEEYIATMPDHQWDLVKENIQLFITPNVFETRANNKGLKTSEGKYAIIVQDDMIVKEYGWNERLVKPMETWPDIFAVSARCAHNWDLNPSSQHIHENFLRSDSWCDIVGHNSYANKNTIPRNMFSIRDSCNRGPLALDLATVQKLGYLDERVLKQDMDDHLLMFKAYKELGKKCGYYGIDFESRDEWGGTRENGQPKPWLLEANHHNMRLFYEDNKERLQNRVHYNEDRILE